MLLGSRRPRSHFSVFFGKDLRGQLWLLVVLASEASVYVHSFGWRIIHLLHRAFRPHLVRGHNGFKAEVFVAALIEHVLVVGVEAHLGLRHPLRARL